ncbi:hypothetical protein LGT41_0002365 [Abyssibius alkaniclasticus]|nr:hypothetical protein [Abyssibius alkaniclasticus]UPH71682.1 hypothetical protein LGT41_0002365 [Abyssibius alkaniclasticus]|tara:strand:- start:296 stop:442 length:147 start_codon:yes stop_codon:yes gene_type:complete
MKISLLSLFAATTLLAGCETAPPPAPAENEVIMLESEPAPSVEEVLSF